MCVCVYQTVFVSIISGLALALQTLVKLKPLSVPRRYMGGAEL
jgi:hypothetical protein